jgi:TonB family protein
MMIMEREKKFSRLTRIGLSVMLTATATFMFAIAVSGQAAKPAAPANEAADEKQAQVGANPNLPFVQVEKMPVFPGGDAALLKYLAENTKYPENAKKNKITGKVILRFIVEKDCTISDVTILQSVDPEIDAEAIRVVKSLPKFAEPAMEKGKIVSVFYMVPITFSLK